MAIQSLALLALPIGASLPYPLVRLARLTVGG